MKEIVVLSGKGGTGKTSLTAAFAVLAGDSVVMADCDVDAADLHLLLAPDFAVEKEFRSGELAVIDPDQCNGCGRCADVCRFGAVEPDGDAFRVEPLDCEGCGYCARVCPAEAIANHVRRVGDSYRSTIRTGTAMAHARLDIGAENSGRLVAEVKNEARRAAAEIGRDIVLVDGSPGVGCPVVSSLSGAVLAVMVTEPTRSGLHDLERVLELVARFEIPAVCILNKADLHQGVRDDLRTFLADREIPLLAELPYDEAFAVAISDGATVVERDPDLHDTLARCWTEILRSAGVEPREIQ